MTQSPHFSPASPRLGLWGATALGVASMLGAGVFIVFAPAADLAGGQLVISVLIAGVVAALNARSMMQLSQRTDDPGGAYVYGRKHLNKTFGFLAGWAFVVGKIGSAASVALVIGNYAFESNPKLIALLAVMLMTLVNLLGINRTALGATILAGITVSFLFLLLFSSQSDVQFEPIAITEPNLVGTLQGSALIFFAFAGYARVATLGSEVKNPRKTIPKAIFLALSFTLVLYLALASTLKANLGPALESSIAPVADLANLSTPWVPSGVVLLVAAASALGSLLALLAGIARTAAAMGKDGELPGYLAARSSRTNVPYRAEFVVSFAIILLVLVGDVVWTIGISSFAVLIYYAVANLAAFKDLQASAGQKFFSLFGLLVCLVLCAMVPINSLLVGSIGLAVGLLLRAGLKALKAKR